jgi:hypothetical protein
MVFLILANQMLGWYLKLAAGSAFHILSNPLNTLHHSIRRCRTSALEKASLNKRRNNESYTVASFHSSKAINSHSEGPVRVRLETGKPELFRSFPSLYSHTDDSIIQYHIFFPFFHLFCTYTFLSHPTLIHSTTSLPVYKVMNVECHPYRILHILEFYTFQYQTSCFHSVRSKWHHWNNWIVLFNQRWISHR